MKTVKQNINQMKIIKKVFACCIILLLCGCALAKKVKTEHTNNAVLPCNECDSLYNLVCFTRDSLIFGEDVDVQPEYPGGDSELMRFIRNNTQYPKAFMGINFQGVVVVRFIIDKTGTVVCPRVILSLYPEFDAEALRVVQLLPKWIPGRKDYKRADFCYTVPVIFRSYAERNRDILWIIPKNE